MMNPPVIVTPWYCSYRLLEAMLLRNRPMAKDLEWWLLYCRYPLLKVQDAMSDTRKAQNLAKELNLQWWDGGCEMLPKDALKLWATQASHIWTPDQKIVLLGQDSSPNKKHFVDVLNMVRESDFAACKSHRFPGISMINANRLIDGTIETAKCKPIKVDQLKDVGGPDSTGGCYPLGLYDPEQLDYEAESKDQYMSTWLESRAKK